MSGKNFLARVGGSAYDKDDRDFFLASSAAEETTGTGTGSLAENGEAPAARLLNYGEKSDL